RWKEFIETQIAEDGSLPHEVHRDSGRRGLWYSHFSLMPQAIAAEVLLRNGHDLYDYTSPSGRSLEMAFHRIALWVNEPASCRHCACDAAELLNPRSFSYFELLNAHWPDPVAEKLILEDRPLTADHGAPFLTFTHGRPLQKPE